MGEDEGGRAYLADEKPIQMESNVATEHIITLNNGSFHPPLPQSALRNPSAYSTLSFSIRILPNEDQQAAGTDSITYQSFKFCVCLCVCVCECVRCVAGWKCHSGEVEWCACPLSVRSTDDSTVAALLRLSFFLSVCLSVSLSIYLSIFLSFFLMH